MPRGFRPTLISVIVLMVAPATASLDTEIERVLRGTFLSGANVGISIREAASGEEIIAVAANEPMIPASNMKLLTSGAALHVLGPDFKFETRLLRDGDRLIVRGGGDPAFGDPRLLKSMQFQGATGIDVEIFLQLWAQAIVSAGLEHIREIVIDDRIFDREFVHPSWPADQLNRRYCAQVSGLNFHANVLHLYPRPRSGMRPDISDVRPLAPWLIVSNRATSRTSAGDKSDVWVSRKPGGNDMTIFGNVKSTYRAEVPVTVHEPGRFFGRILADRLRQAGIEVDAVRLPALDEPRDDGTPIGPVITSSIGTIITICNTQSANLYAESLLKRLAAEITGQSGSWHTGSAIVRHVVYERLDDPALSVNLRIADGSGLSRDNSIAPATMTAWLSTFDKDERLGPPFIDSLPIAGRTGTLKKRFRGIDLGDAVVQAKSGYLNGVSCLSGFVTMPDGRRRIFSILINGISMSTIRAAKGLQEEIVGLIIEDMAASAKSRAAVSE